MANTMTSKCLVAFAVLGAIVSCTAAMDMPYGTATLTGANQMPPITTSTNGTFMMGNVMGDSIAWNLEVQNVTDMIMAHIHYGNASSSGPPVVTLVPLSGDKASNNTLGLMQLTTPVSGNQKFNGTFTTKDFMSNLGGKLMTLPDFVKVAMTGDFYVNVHTVANPAGVIRGQIAISAASPAGGPMSSPSMSSPSMSSPSMSSPSMSSPSMSSPSGGSPSMSSPSISSPSMSSPSGMSPSTPAPMSSARISATASSGGALVAIMAATFALVF